MPADPKLIAAKAMLASDKPRTSQQAAADAARYAGVQFADSIRSGVDPSPAHVSERYLMADPEYSNFVQQHGAKFATPSERVTAYRQQQGPLYGGLIKPVMSGVSAGITSLAKSAYGVKKAAQAQPVSMRKVNGYDAAIERDMANGRAMEDVPGITATSDVVTRAAPAALAIASGVGPIAGAGVAASAALAAGETSADFQARRQARGAHPAEAELASRFPAVVTGAADAALAAVPGGKVMRPYLKPMMPLLEAKTVDATQAGILAASDYLPLTKPNVATR